ncbi:MAG TPA: aspartate aminotransferase family protein [Myxococcota bacterium]|nr:aspartate aminotransferase family protein [Myxococcota bacterium]
MDADAIRRFAFTPGTGGLAIERAEGCWLVAPGGHRILDAAGGAIVSNIGHGRAEVGEAMARASARIDYVVPPFATDERVQLASRLRERWLPPELSRALFTSGGSESTDAAIRIARQHHVARGEPSRWKVIGRDLSYHGITLATLAVGGHSKRRKGFDPLLLDFPHAPACYALRCGLCRGHCELQCADALEALILREGPETVAAFIAEPIGGSTAGALVPPDGYGPRVAEICARHGVLLIADEVMTGFGRTGRRFGIEHWGVVPDLLVGGKGLAGGYAPMGAVFAKESVLAPIAATGDDVMFYTFGGHPASCAASLVVLDILERERLVARAEAMGRVLRERLAARLEKHPHVAEIRGRGLLQAVELVKDRDTLAPFPADARVTARVVATGIANGAFFYPGGCDPARDVICLGPPFVIDETEIDFLVDVLERSIDGVVSKLG